MEYFFHKNYQHFFCLFSLTIFKILNYFEIIFIHTIHLYFNDMILNIINFYMIEKISLFFLFKKYPYTILNFTIIFRGKFHPFTSKLNIMKYISPNQ